MLGHPCLHGVAVDDAQIAHDDPTRALLALLDFELARLVRELETRHDHRHGDASAQVQKTSANRVFCVFAHDDRKYAFLEPVLVILVIVAAVDEYVVLSASSRTKRQAGLSPKANTKAATCGHEGRSRLPARVQA
jgi:hypothetical protein